MFPDRSVTYVPGPYRALPNKWMQLTRSAHSQAERGPRS